MEILYWILLGVVLLISYFLWVDFIRKKHEDLKNNRFRIFYEIGYLILYFVCIYLQTYLMTH